MTAENRCDKKTFRFAWIALFVLACLWVIVKPYDVQAAATGTNGTCSWEIDYSGVLTIRPTNGTEGTLSSYTSGNGPWYSYRAQIKKVVVEPGVKAGAGCHGLFYSFSNCTEMSLSNLDTSNVTNMSGMFDGCYSLTNLDVSRFDTGNLTSMKNMFSGCSNLTSLDVSGLDTSKVTDMSYMFDSCSGLTSLNVSGFDTSNVTDMSRMFYNCCNLTSLDVSGFDTGKVTDMNNMFSCCSKLTNLDVSRFNTGNLTSIKSMFSGCSKLTSLDVSGLDTSKVTDMSYMFDGCSGLASLDVSGFDTSNLTDMSFMFESCSGLASLDLSEWDTGNATNMYAMFSGCSSLTSLDLSGWDTGNVTYMGSMFSGCSGLTSRDLSGWDTGSVTDMQSMFYNCSSLTSLDLSGLDTSNVTNMSFMFQSCHGLTSLDLSGWDTGNVSDMSAMFSDCSSLTSLDVSGFDASNMTYINGMFNGCSSLTSLDLSGWNTGNVTDMGGMFSNCSNLTSLNLSGWDTENVTNIRYMFYNCSKLSSIKLAENFDFVAQYDTAVLPTPPTNPPHTGKWIQEEGLVEEPKTAEWLRDNYDGATMAGTWVWEVDDTHGVVMFNANGGFTSERSIAADNEDEEITMPDATNTTRPHYALSGWNDKADGTGNSYTIGRTYNDIVKFGKTVTLYAQWEPSNLREYRIKYYRQNRNKTGYSLFETEKDAADYGESITLTATKDYPGYIKPQAPQTEIIKEDDSTVFSFYYDIRTYNVHFDPNPDSPDADITGETADIVLMGDESKQIDNRFGYAKHALAGWNTKADGTGESCSTGEYLTVKKLIDMFGSFGEEDPQNVTLYAQWLSNEDTKLEPTEGEVRIQAQADETVVIPDLPAGTKYTIKETDLPKGWNYNGGDITGEIQGNQVSNVEITNEYTAEGTAEIIAHKRLENGTLNAGDFRFTLYQEMNQDIDEGNVDIDYIKNNCQVVGNTTNDDIDTRKNVADDNGDDIENPWYNTAPAKFEVQYTQADIGKTYTYYILEENTGDEFIEYDDRYEKVTVTVSDTGHGNLNADVEYDADGALFINEKKPEVNKKKSGSLTVNKELEGYQTDQTFDFNVDFHDKNGVESKDGYSYLVVNTKDKDSYKIIEDGTIYAYSYTENLNEQGEQLMPYGASWNESNIRGTGRTEAANEAHVVTIPGAQNIHVELTCKTSGGDWMDIWKGAHPEYTANNNYNDALFDGYNYSGTQSFDIDGDSVTFGFYSGSSSSGDYGYYAVITGGGKTVEYDESKILRRDTISSGEQLHLKAGETAIFEELPVDLVYNIEEVEKPGYELTGATGTLDTIREDTTAQAIFTNIYNATGEVTLQAQKHLTGGTLAGDDFSFTFYNENDEVLQTKNNAANGSVTFEPIQYTQADAGKTFIYYIKENTGNDDGIIYDQHPVQVKVDVQDNGDGTLSAVPEYQDSTTFTNTALSSITVSKQVSGNMASRDKQFGFTLSLEGQYYDHIITYTKTTASGTTTGTVYDPETQSGNPEPTLNYNFTLSHGDSITFDGIVRSVEYDIAETDSNKDSYTTTAQSSQAEIETISHIVHAKGTLTDAVTAAYTNSRGAAVPTTAQTAMKFLLPALMMAGAVISLMLYRKKEITNFENSDD